MAEADAYQFKPHERPFMPGSPATPDHPMPRRIGYALIGVLIALTAGFANSLLVANLQQIQGALGITSVEANWITGVYSMTNVCASFMLIKVRQQFGLQRVTRFFLLGFVLLAGVQVFVQSYPTEIMVRALTGIIASGFTPLGFFYIMQSLSAKARLMGMILGIGLSQVALPLARVFSPLLLASGDIQNLYIFEFGLALLCLGSIALLRLPPSERAQVFERLDFLTLALFAPGMALLTAVLVQGRTVWWTQPWIGYATAAAIVLIGAAMLVEHNRANPMLNTRWMRSAAILRFAGVAATMRILLAEQNFGSIALLQVTGMGPEQLVGLFAVVTGATLAGLLLSLVRLDTNDLLRPVVVSITLIMIAAFMDADATNLTRPANLYLSQAIMGFAAIYFLGSTMMVGVLRAMSKGPSHMVSYSAVFGISQTIGGLAGSAVLGTFQYLRTRYHLQQLASGIVATDPQVAARLQQLGGAYGRVLGDPALRQAEGAVLLTQQLTREANILAYNDVFMLIGTLAAIALVLVGGFWLSLRIRGINPLAGELAALQAMRANRQ
ncbi:MAG: MFS transporter [Sphingomonas sp.]|uniref:MFS transporter n=1 Tax=Sphingomonas sp. TaxID=28214 RepID=UPI001B2BB1DD|nr:MFS transporter [Sphingomonas sp.]MBO9622376.1 MFS transporter [Sphingomonas sp.]